MSKKLIIAAVLNAVLGSGIAFSANRIVEGTVSYRGGEPASDAAVQVEDRTTLQVISHITDKNGHYHFEGLSQDKDYEIRATKKGYWSKSRALSHFNSRTLETVDLTLKPEN